MTRNGFASTLRRTIRQEQKELQAMGKDRCGYL